MMKLFILAALSIFLATSLYNWSTGRVRLMQTWSIGRDVIALSPDSQLLAAPSDPPQERKIGILPIRAGTTIKLYTFPDGEVVRTLVSPMEIIPQGHS